MAQNRLYTDHMEESKRPQGRPAKVTEAMRAEIWRMATEGLKAGAIHEALAAQPGFEPLSVDVVYREVRAYKLAKAYGEAS